MERQGRLRRRWIFKPTGSGNQGVILFWNETLQAYVPTDSDEVIWDDTNKRVGVNNSSPTSELDVTGTTTTTRLLAGGITE